MSGYAPIERSSTSFPTTDSQQHEGKAGDQSGQSPPEHATAADHHRVGRTSARTAPVDTMASYLTSGSRAEIRSGWRLDGDHPSAERFGSHLGEDGVVAHVAVAVVADQ